MVKNLGHQGGPKRRRRPRKKKARLSMNTVYLGLGANLNAPRKQIHAPLKR